jgi:hypothetical protein
MENTMCFYIIKLSSPWHLVISQMLGTVPQRHAILCHGHQGLMYWEDFFQGCAGRITKLVCN